MLTFLLFSSLLFAQNTLCGVEEFSITVNITGDEKFLLERQIQQESELKLRYYGLKPLDPIFDGGTPHLFIYIYTDKLELKKYDFDEDYCFYRIELQLRRTVFLKKSKSSFEQIFVPVWSSNIIWGRMIKNSLVDKAISESTLELVNKFINEFLKQNEGRK